MACYAHLPGGKPCFADDSYVGDAPTTGSAPYINGAGTTLLRETSAIPGYIQTRGRWLLTANDICYNDRTTAATITTSVRWTPYASWVGGIFPEGDPDYTTARVATIGLNYVLPGGVGYTVIWADWLEIDRDNPGWGEARTTTHQLIADSSWYTLFQNALATDDGLAFVVATNPNAFRRPVDTPPATYDNGIIVDALWTPCEGQPPRRLRQRQRDDLRARQRESQQLTPRGRSYW